MVIFCKFSQLISKILAEVETGVQAAKQVLQVVPKMVPFFHKITRILGYFVGLPAVWLPQDKTLILVYILLLERSEVLQQGVRKKTK